MRRAGRVWALCLYLGACIAITATRDYGVPIEIKIWDTGRSPLAHMVDVTNGFGLRVLAEHNFLNDNNIAFSPYGLMGIMVALYEGVDGESSYQIQRGMQLPWNRNVMRVGFRDIHRTLKTYFVPEEGFLAGLALNNENVTFNDGYKKILRFYGFDLENDQLPTLPPANATTASNETAQTTTTAPPVSETSTMAAAINSETMPGSTSSTKEETTLNPNAETIDIDSRSPTDATTPIPSLAPNSETTTITTSIATTTDMTTAAETTITMETTTSAPTTSEATTTPMVPTIEASTITTVAQSMSSDAETIGQQTSLATAALTLDPSMNEVSSTVDMGSSAVTTESSAPSTNQMTESTITTSEATTIRSTTDSGGSSAATTSTVISESTLETLQRRKKSIVDFIFTNPPYIDDYFFYRSSYYDGVEDRSPAFDDKMFLANGLKSVQVTYMHYDTVLEHAYLPHLEASALRLPLDSDRYYLLVVLPNHGGSAELSRLLARMARESDLADVYAALRPRRVRAVVPSFMVKGHVTLTTDLQKLGIRDVFEPRQRDFMLMTNQAGVYVRSIEQAVSVAIRKYRPDDHKKNRYVSNRDPVKFSATYPFLYFVMDASIHVALMAGKMTDPLNSRIL